MSQDLARQLRFARDGGALRRWNRMAVPGTGFLSLGMAAFGLVIIVICLLPGIGSWAQLPRPMLSALAWLMVLVAVAATTVTVVRLGERMPDAVAALIVVCIAAAAALDLIAVWPLADGISHAFAAIAAGSALLALAALRSTLEALVPTLCYAAAMITAAVFGADGSSAVLIEQLPLLSLATVPSLAAILITREYRHIVHVQLDRTLVLSSVRTPSTGSDLLAGAELARLDLAAETLLRQVAEGRLRLPLARSQAQLAAELATELRLNLIEGRRATWLYHAVQDSTVLADIVSIEDPGSLGALLDEQQRDGLLGALWQLAVLPSLNEPEVLVEFLPAEDSAVFPNGALLPIRIRITGLRRSRITPAIWESVQQVGAHSASGGAKRVEIQIRCHVQNAQNR